MRNIPAKMVRINLIDPHALSDQHLVAEYNEILMLLGYVRKYPSLEGIPLHFRLGDGHIRFFKDKLGYIGKRHARISEEMKRRGFAVNRRADIGIYPRAYRKDFVPTEADRRVIRERIAWKLRAKRGFYRYYGRVEDVQVLVGKVMHAG